MEQIQFIKQKLSINDFPQLKTKQLGTLKAAQIILFCLLVTFIFSLFGFYSLTYLTLGFGIPIVCRYKNIKIFNYWQCLAFLLYLRTITQSLQSLDGLILILLWHPNFRYGQKIIDYIKTYKEKGQVDRVVKQIKKVL